MGAGPGVCVYYRVLQWGYSDYTACIQLGIFLDSRVTNVRLGPNHVHTAGNERVGAGAGAASVRGHRTVRTVAGEGGRAWVLGAARGLRFISRRPAPALPAAREQDRRRPGAGSCLRAVRVSQWCTYSAPAAALRRCGVAPQALRSGVPHMPLRLRGGADPSVCALPRAHVHPRVRTRSSPLLAPPRDPRTHRRRTARTCESDYQETLPMTAGVCASARRVPGPVPAESACVPGSHTP